MTFTGRSLAAVALVLAGTSVSAFAGVVNVDAVAGAAGTAAPPATVGGFTMTPFGDDARPTFGVVTDVPSPLGGVVGFSRTMDHFEIGSPWATWSHGYTGDVYYTQGDTTVTLTMPAGTVAFYLYAEPNPFSVHTFTATATDGSTSSFDFEDVDGSGGARRFEFWMSGGGTLASLTMSSDVDFAIGEFGIADGVEINPTALVPLPTSALSGLALLGVIGGLRLRRRKTS